MRIIVLGSGIASGFPSWNDGSPRALRARQNDPDVPIRRGAALAVSADGERYSLFEAPLHLAQTLSQDPRFAPRERTRAAPVDSLVLSSAELDACAGALALRTGLSIRIASPHGSRSSLLDHDASFESLAPIWTGFGWDQAIPLDRDGRLEARLFPLAGPVPDHLRDKAPRAGRARAGVRITDRTNGTRVVWAPRIARFDSALLAELREADVRFVDGTLFRPEEARELRPGTREPSELGHVPVDGQAGSLAWLSGMSGESWYVHIPGTNPMCDLRSDAIASVRRAGVEVACDGLELTR